MIMACWSLRADRRRRTELLEFAQKVQKKVIDTGLREKICGDCEWNEICSEKSSRWENKNILR